MRWYKFTKTVRGHIVAVKYIYFDDNVENEDIDLEARQFGEDTPDGDETSYNVSCVAVRKPSKDWILREIERLFFELKYTTKELDLYVRFLKGGKK